MDPPLNSLKASLKSLLTEIESIRNTPTNEKVYIHRICDLEGKFRRCHEEVTPKPVLSDLYSCVGRIKFNGDMLAIHLEILDNNKVQRLWPARATWKVELVDDDDNSIEPFRLGEASCLFNKPRQGFSSHSTDWISIRYNEIHQSGLIGPDNSMTIRWTVLVEPVLQNIYLDQFVQLLINAEEYNDFFNGGEITQIKEGLSEIRNKSEEHEQKISSLQSLLPEIDNKLNVIEKRQKSIDDQFKTIKYPKAGNSEDATMKEQELFIERLKQENQQLQTKLEKQEDTMEKLRQENKELHDKFAKPTIMKAKEIKSSPPEKVEVHKRNALQLGQNDNTSSHQKYVPVKDFLLKHLPPCYQHVEMLNLIKSLADIAVKIEVDDVNHERKQFLDKTAQASSDMKITSIMKPGSSSTLIDSQTDVNICDIISSSNLLGSGKVDDVFIRTAADGPCPCDTKCQEWGEIRVLTSAQLMYDDDDAKHFVCTFFYDDDERMDQLKYARDDRIVMRDLKKDVCMFLCVTCDVELVRKLEGMLDTFEQSWENAFDKYVHTVKWENERLTVLVFHPNGLRKHISLGKSLTPNVESFEKRIEYDNPTFKGSEGAYVLIPDFNVNDEV